jgi:serine/threonine-protein kinase
VTGPGVPVLEGMTSGQAGGAQFAVSSNGTMVYAPGTFNGLDAPIYWMDRDGNTTVLRPTPAEWINLHLSPDGRRLALAIRGRAQLSDIWVYESARDTLTRLTLDPAGAETPAWTPDGNRIAFGSRRADRATFNLYWQRADGTGDVQRLTDSKNSQHASSWHPSGKFLAFVETSVPTVSHVMILPIDGDEASGWKPGKPTVFLNGAAIEAQPEFSPDGRWLAYASTESGQLEVYVRSFPGPGRPWQISTGGGGYPKWSRARHELIYTRAQQFMVAAYTTEGNSFRAEKPRPWSAGSYVARPGGPFASNPYDLHPDGDRVALAKPFDLAAAGKQNKVVFVFNFFDYLRKIAPGTK